MLRARVNPVPRGPRGSTTPARPKSATPVTPSPNRGSWSARPKLIRAGVGWSRRGRVVARGRGGRGRPRAAFGPARRW